MSVTMRDVQDMMDEMGICRSCKEHKPCGCETLIKCPNCLTENFDEDARVCYSCDYDEAKDPNHVDTQDITNGDYLVRRGTCITCGSKNNNLGGFCSENCQKTYSGGG